MNVEGIKTRAEKFERGGRIAVLYSPGYGAGWSTWGGKERMLFDPQIVQAVLDGDLGRAADIAERIDPDFYTGGAENLKIERVEKGTQFRINEYDGSESIEIIGATSYLTA